MDHLSNDQPNSQTQLDSPERSEGSPIWDKTQKEDTTEADLHKNSDGARSQKLKDDRADSEKLENKKGTNKAPSNRILRFSEYYS